MSAFFIAHGKVKNPEKLGEYSQKFGPTLVRFGGKLLIKGKVSGSLCGEIDHHMTAIVKFADIESIDEWYKSPEYQALIPIRDEAADIRIIKYSEI